MSGSLSSTRVDEPEGSSYRSGGKAQGVALLLAPEAEVEDDVGSESERFQDGPDKAALHDVAAPSFPALPNIAC